jgi:hypothetical protein
MRILLIALAAASVAVAAAQDSPEAWVVPFAVAHQPTCIPAFNDRLAGHVPLPGERQLGWGIEVRTLVSHILVGPLYMRAWSEASDTSYTVRTDMTSLFGTAGFKIAPFSFIAIVPTIGIGGVNQTFSIHERGDIALDSLLSNPGRTATFSPGMKLAGLAALDLCLSVNTTAGRYGLDLRGGWLYSPFSLDWRLGGGSDLTGVPATRLGGPFVSAGIALLPSPVTESSSPTAVP